MAAGPNKLVLDHDELITSLIKVRNQTERERVVAAFAVCLKAKRLDLRSPLGSYAFHLNHPRHKLNGYNPSSDGNVYLQCKLCPYFDNKGKREVEIDFRKYGELRRSATIAGNFARPAYAFADLTLFSQAETPEPGAGDWDTIREMLKRIRSLPSTAKLTDLNKSVAGLFPSDKFARQQVLEILGFCGVLQPKSRPLVTDRFFCRDKDQFHPHFHTRDWAYPVSWWTGADGVNEAAVAFWFPGQAR